MLQPPTALAGQHTAAVELLTHRSRTTIPYTSNINHACIQVLQHQGLLRALHEVLERLLDELVRSECTDLLQPSAGCSACWRLAASELVLQCVCNVAAGGSGAASLRAPALEWCSNKVLLGFEQVLEGLAATLAKVSAAAEEERTRVFSLVGLLKGRIK